MALLILAQCCLTASFPILSKPLLGADSEGSSLIVPRSPAQTSGGFKSLNGGGGVELEGSLAVHTVGDGFLGVVVLTGRVEAG